MKIKVYQVKDNEELESYRFKSYGQLDGIVDPTHYRCVYQGICDAQNLDQVFAWLNDDEMPTTYQGHALSVSDVVIVESEMNQKTDPDRLGAFFCDAVGWRKIPFDESYATRMDGLRALMLEPGKEPYETYVRGDLRSLQNAVSQHGEDSLIEISYPFADSDLVLVGNEEAKLIGMSPNRYINGEVYAGPVFVLREDSYGQFTGLSLEDVKLLSSIYQHPDDIKESEVEPYVGFKIIGF